MIAKRINYRGGGMDMGNTRSQARSASMGNTTSRSTSSGTGGSPGNLGGGGGGQDSDYRRYEAPTRPTYDSTNIDQKPITGADFQRSQNEFINNLNQNNLLRAQQTNTPFVPYQGGARTTDYYNPNPFKGILNLLAGVAIPGAGFLINQGRKLKDGIMSLNDQIQNSDFGRSTSLMDYLDMRKYGGYDEREMARRINMDESKNLQARIDAGEFDGMVRSTDYIPPYMAEVTKMDLEKFKQPMTQTMDYDTYMSINPGSTLTPYEFEQLKQGNITSPGSYQA